MPDSPTPPSRRSHAWWLVLCLIGLDYFSSLAYLPSIAVASNGALAPLAAVGVILMTLGAALPVYWYVVGRSPHGTGATGLLEHILHGWGAKLLILVLLGFIATDFVITRTLSMADASTHILANPFWRDHSAWVTNNKEMVRNWFPALLRGRFFDFWTEQLVLTVILSVFAFVLYTFLVRGLTRGFLRTAVFVVGLYLALTALILIMGLAYISDHPERVAAWRAEVSEQIHEDRLESGSAGLMLLVLALAAFPSMALGLSGFELSMASAPVVSGSPHDDPSHPRGRIRRTRFMLLIAALIMSAFVIGSMWVVTLLVPPETIGEGKTATHRALAYLAHGGPLVGAVKGEVLGPWFGPVFGTLYDLSTVMILCLAGASATISLREIVPQFLHRFGMQLEWAHRIDVITHLFNGVILVVTIAFQASVNAQRWAYATSVLALLLAASLAAVIDLRQRWRGSVLMPILVLPFGLIAGLFLGMAVLTVVQNRTGLGIALGFVAVVFLTAFLSRWLRSTELRFQGFAYADEASKARWDAVCQLPFQVLVPHRPGLHSLAEKEHEIRVLHRIGPEIPVIFIEAELGDPSDFLQAPLMKIVRDDGREIIRVTRCTSIAHVVAAIGLAFREVGRPPEIHFGWSNESPITANLHFLLLGQGNVPWMVRELLRKAEPDPARQPRVIVG
jgi:hypothetical protein